MMTASDNLTRYIEKTVSPCINKASDSQKLGLVDYFRRFLRFLLRLEAMANMLATLCSSPLSFLFLLSFYIFPCNSVLLHQSTQGKLSSFPDGNEPPS